MILISVRSEVHSPAQREIDGTGCTPTSFSGMNSHLRDRHPRSACLRTLLHNVTRHTKANALRSRRWADGVCVQPRRSREQAHEMNRLSLAAILTVEMTNCEAVQAEVLAVQSTRTRRSSRTRPRRPAQDTAASQVPRVITPSHSATSANKLGPHPGTRAYETAYPCVHRAPPGELGASSCNGTTVSRYTRGLFQSPAVKANSRRPSALVYFGQIWGE